MVLGMFHGRTGEERTLFKGLSPKPLLKLRAAGAVKKMGFQNFGEF